MKISAFLTRAWLVRAAAVPAVLSVLLILFSTTDQYVTSSRTAHLRRIAVLATSYDAPITRVRCTDVTGTRHPDIYRSCEYENMYFINCSFFALVARGNSKTVLPVWYSSKHGNAFKPRIKEMTAELATEISRVGVVTAHPGVFVFFHQLWTFNIGHALWDGLYAAWVAYVRLGLDVNADFTLIVDQFDSKPDEQSADFIFRTFGGRSEYYRWDTVKEWKGWHRFGRVVIGSGGKGQRWMTADHRLPGFKEGAVTSFRDRMYKVFGLSAPRTWTRRPRTDVRAIIVHNKRYSNKDRAEINNVVTLARGLHYNLTYIDWGLVGNKPDNFKSHLKVLKNTDIYISGPGTGMMYASFLPDRAVFVALGAIADEDDVRSVRYMEQYVLEGTPSLRALFYPSRLRPSGIRAQVLTGLIDEAVDLVSNGFDIPVDPEINLSAEGKVFVRACAQVLSKCHVVLDAMNGLSPEWGCLTDGWANMAVYELGFMKPNERNEFADTHCMPKEFRKALREEYKARQKTDLSLAPPCRGSNCTSLLQYNLA